MSTPVFDIPESRPTRSWSWMMAPEVVLIDDVMLTEGEEAGWVSDGVSGEWSWDQVDEVQMKMLAD